MGGNRNDRVWIESANELICSIVSTAETSFTCWALSSRLCVNVRTSLANDGIFKGLEDLLLLHCNNERYAKHFAHVCSGVAVLYCSWPYLHNRGHLDEMKFSCI
jgi:hypothetical protein